MNIGIVTTWFERGASYVSKTYKAAFDLLGHKTFIYSRGGDNNAKVKSTNWNESFVFADKKYNDTNVSKHKILKWIKKNQIQLLFFNEQQNFKILPIVKKKFPKILLGSYIDYYKEDTIPLFDIFDFVVCNTKRHQYAMRNHKQAFYIPWTTDLELFNNEKRNYNLDTVTFFHSAGMSIRKGTDLLIETFINSALHLKSSLVIHSQKPLSFFTNRTISELEENNIKFIEKTVTAPGLYHLGDVYVYPTKLDGLGLTMYEAMASGMPVITTDFPPMNEAVGNDRGRLLNVSDFYCRSDAYYFPMAICDQKSLIEKMQEFIDNPSLVGELGKNARKYMESNFSFNNFVNSIDDVLKKIKLQEIDVLLCKKIKKMYCNDFLKAIRNISEHNNFFRKIKYFFIKER